MSARAEELATRFEQANQELIDMVSQVEDADLSATCPAEGWTAAAVAAHVGGGHFGIVEYLVKPVVEGREIPPFDMNSFNESNATEAAANAAKPKEEVLATLREQGAMAAAYLRGLSDDDLERTITLPVFGENPVTAQTVIEMVLIGHPLDHGNSLRAGLGHQVAHAVAS
ncbi:MAG: DinB family protein [Thermomicrobiales bacterium]